MSSGSWQKEVRQKLAVCSMSSGSRQVGGQVDVGSVLHVLGAQVGGQVEVGSVLHVLRAPIGGGQAEVDSVLHVLWAQAEVGQELMCPLTFHFTSSKIHCFST